MKKKTAIVINTATVIELTSDLTELATENHLVTLVNRLIEKLGEPDYMEVGRGPRKKIVRAQYLWPYTKNTTVCVEFDSVDGLSFHVGDEDGYSDGAPLWHLSAVRASKKKKISDKILTPEQYSGMMAHMRQSPGNPDSQVLYLRDLLIKLLGPINFAGGGFNESNIYGWSTGRAELILGNDKDGITLQLKDNNGK